MSLLRLLGLRGGHQGAPRGKKLTLAFFASFPVRPSFGRREGGSPRATPALRGNPASAGAAHVGQGLPGRGTPTSTVAPSLLPGEPP